MTTTLLSPDQIKSIASEIRSMEKDRLGKQLPNTTALNAITRSLGLGSDFRTYKATHAAAADGSNDIIYSEILFVFENDATDEDLLLEDDKNRLIAHIENHGYTVDLTPGAHGFSCLMIWSQREDRTMEELKFLQSEIRDLIEVMVSADELPPIKAEAIWQGREKDQMLGVNFLYHDNNQICTANVSESNWKAREQLGLGDEVALLLFGGDCEIETSYDKSDITVQDVIVDVVYFQE